MRERKFRAWHKIDRKWLDLSHLFLDCWGKVIGYTFKGDTWSIDNVELVEYTGWKDKKGVEEYYKDIVRHNEGVLGVIEWDDKCGAWYYQWQDGKKTYPRSNWDIIDEVIIGNTFENADLLGE